MPFDEACPAVFGGGTWQHLLWAGKADKYGLVVEPEPSNENLEDALADLRERVEELLEEVREPDDGLEPID